MSHARWRVFQRTVTGMGAQYRRSRHAAANVEHRLGLDVTFTVCRNASAVEAVEPAIANPGDRGPSPGAT
jgi:hypothetical protein